MRLRTKSVFAALAASSSTWLRCLAATTTTLIPTSSLDSQEDFDKYWGYHYPWGTDHNGSARMALSQVSLANGTVTVTARPVQGQRPASHGGQQIPIRYLSGAVHALQHFTVGRGGGLDYRAELRATTGRGTWPAWWLTYVDGWPPEIDMAEWKGSGKISFNTFNTSSQVRAHDVAYPSPGDFHAFRCEVRDENGRDVSVRFFMDGELVTEQYGRDYVGKAMYLIMNLQMEGSSGSPGPNTNTEYSARNISVISYEL